MRIKLLRGTAALLLVTALLIGVAAAGFTDVKESDWFSGAVEYCVENGLMTGTGGGKFSPYVTMSRAMMVAVLHRMSGETTEDGTENPFTDVPEGKWYTKDILWAYTKGIASGTPENKFLPDNPLTRQDAACLIVRFLTVQHITLDTDSAKTSLFSDMASVSDYAKEAVDLLRLMGLSAGDGNGCYLPKKSLTRAEAAVMLTKLHQLIEAQEEIPESTETETEILTEVETEPTESDTDATEPETEPTEPNTTEPGEAWIDIQPGDSDKDGWLPLIP